MGQLLVRNLSEDLIEALKAQAKSKGRSAEEEHREILRKALGRNKFSLKAHLFSIPVSAPGEQEDDLAPRSRERQREIKL